MKKMKSLKGGLAGILFTAGLLAASCTSDQSSSAVTIVNRPDCTQTNVNYVGNRLPLKPMNFIKLPVGKYSARRMVEEISRITERRSDRSPE